MAAFGSTYDVFVSNIPLSAKNVKVYIKNTVACVVNLHTMYSSVNVYLVLLIGHLASRRRSDVCCAACVRLNISTHALHAQ